MYANNENQARRSIEHEIKVIHSLELEDEEEILNDLETVVSMNETETNDLSEVPLSILEVSSSLISE